MHLEYGPVIRFSHSELSYADPRAWKDIYGHHGGESNFPRHPQWYPKAPNGSHTVLSADNDSHARIRRLLAHAFSERALKEQESLVQVYFNQLIDKLHKQADGRDINIDEWFIFTTFDVAGDLEFGESFSCIENGALHPWIKVMLVSLAVQIPCPTSLIMLGTFQATYTDRLSIDGASILTPDCAIFDPEETQGGMAPTIPILPDESCQAT